MSSPTILRGIAPEMASLPDTELEFWIDLAKSWVGEGAWGKRYAAGVAYMAAHLYTISARRGDGMMTSMSAGGVSQSYSNGGTDELSTTGYGATFVSMRKSLVLTPITRW